MESAPTVSNAATAQKKDVNVEMPSSEKIERLRAKSVDKTTGKLDTEKLARKAVRSMISQSMKRQKTVEPQKTAEQQPQAPPETPKPASTANNNKNAPAAPVKAAKAKPVENKPVEPASTPVNTPIAASKRPRESVENTEAPEPKRGAKTAAHRQAAQSQAPPAAAAERPAKRADSGPLGVAGKRADNKGLFSAEGSTFSLSGITFNTPIGSAVTRPLLAARGEAHKWPEFKIGF